MKKAAASLALAIAVGVCHAGEVGPITKAPNYPPPYGAFEYSLLGMQPDQQMAVQMAILKHYGYNTLEEANRACRSALPRQRRSECIADPVAHRHDESLEIKKYGFASWQEAISACLKEKRKHGDTLPYCTVDPFLRLRASEARR